VTPPLDAGLVAQVSRVAWEVPVQLAAFGPPSKLRSTLTTGFVGIGVRSTLREARVSLFGTLALGSAFQVETGSNIATAEAWTGMSNLSCNAGFNPTAQVGLGVSSRASRHMSVFAIATGTIGWKWKDCIPTNQNEGGLPHIPLGAWGPALQAGAAFDIGP
jgi:hypothetical protein